MRIDGQLTLGDVDPKYQMFVDKFRPKKTTDDCYTPTNIYNLVLDWAANEYGFDRNNVVRPFWPGGDYMTFDYPEGCTVVDNPPFSILGQIINDYNRAGVKYFLFAPYLSNLSSGYKASHIITGSAITYENGADVPTAFVTNLDRYLLRSCPDLTKRIKEENEANLAKIRKRVPKYKYPVHVITAANLGYLAMWGEDLRIRKEDCYFIRQLDSQKDKKKTIFGGGFLLSEKAAAEKAAEKAAAEKAAAEKAAAEKAAAEEWKLSQRELVIVRSLGRSTGDEDLPD